MSTDLHDRPRQPSDEGPGRPDPPKSSLSVAQVVGGALAAMTAAFLGSRLSVAGTVVGAALASIIAAVAGALYTASLRRTSRHVSAVLAKVRPVPPGTTAADAPGTPTAGGATAALPPTGPSEPLSTTHADDGWVLPSSSPRTTSPSTPPTRSRIGGKQVLVAALLMFVVAALALTGIELATGRALSGGTGTTVGRVADGGAAASSEPTHRATAKPSASPSAAASTEPEATASSTPSSEPTGRPSATPSAAPSATPSSTPTGPSTTPTAPGAPSGATPAG